MSLLKFKMINYNHTYKIHLTKLLLNSIIKRNMFKSAAPIIFTSKEIMQKRYLSLLAEGTHVLGLARKDATLFLYHQLKFLKNVRLDEDLSKQLFQFLEKTVVINLKINQHTWDIFYPKNPITML